MALGLRRPWGLCHGSGIAPGDGGCAGWCLALGPQGCWVLRIGAGVAPGAGGLLMLALSIGGALVVQDGLPHGVHGVGVGL